MRWLIERFGPDPTMPGIVDECTGDGEQGWQQLVSHEDVVVPGRIKVIAVDGSGPAPVALELQPDEVLYLAHRKHRGVGLEAYAPDWIVLGARGPRGERFVFIAPNGAVMCSPRLGAVD